MSKRLLLSHGALLALVGTFAGLFASYVDQHPRLQQFIDHEAIVIRALGFSCGVERWSVKTLADPAASQINFTPVRTTIPRLVAIPSDQPTAREASTETTAYQLNGTRVIAFKLEADSDIHLELQSVLAGHATMISEIPDPSCVTKNSDPAVAAKQAQIGTARAAFLTYAQSKGLALQTYYQHVNWGVTLRGIFFLDFVHGALGQAKNGAELHPVLYFRGS